MSALFNFNTFLTVVLLVICTCTYIKMQFPAILNDRTGFRGFFWKAARIGAFHFPDDHCLPYVLLYIHPYITCTLEVGLRFKVLIALAHIQCFAARFSS
ncbi:hypothetical protein SORBI_3009G089101 [Sorghum bicolor]|uniref:Protein kish n=1 Tax=Sorghum bicolor TaxID=4558 RepID=A0A1B6P7U3_SORBI|nr:hypothetical protein SORBI_3009G089101 [Sorghum bicolor]